MREIKKVILHTAAHGYGDNVYNTTIEEIDRWHRERGWRGCGYHYLIRFDGDIYSGRLEEEVGAHCLGHNKDSIGICFSGHGDIKPLTPAQIDSCKELLERWPSASIHAHNEFANKSCPGKLVDMSLFRRDPLLVNKGFICDLQNFLFSYGFYDYAVDGIIGPKTREGIRKVADIVLS